MKKPLFRPFLAALLLAAPLFATSCKDDKEDPQPDDENELITTVRYTLTPVGGGAAVTAESKDLDGDGGNAPVTSTLTLAANTTYTGTITFLDESKSPAEDITAEVSAESDEHLVVYTPAPANLVSITRTDRDAPQSLVLHLLDYPRFQRKPPTPVLRSLPGSTGKRGEDR